MRNFVSPLFLQRENFISFQAFPLGGRCPSVHTGADEGPIIERFFVGPDALIGPLGGSFRWGDFAACGRRGTFPAMGKVPKGSPGTRPMDYGSAMLRLGP